MNRVRTSIDLTMVATSAFFIASSCESCSAATTG
jgi:hypothetical protein